MIAVLQLTGTVLSYLNDIKNLMKDQAKIVEKEQVVAKTKVYMLLDKDANINHRDRMERTPIHWAAVTKDLPLLKFLLERGAKINDQDLKVHTPLHLAGRSDKLLIRYLLDHSADQRKKDCLGRTASEYAAKEARRLKGAFF